MIYWNKSNNQVWIFDRYEHLGWINVIGTFQRTWRINTDPRGKKSYSQFKVSVDYVCSEDTRPIRQWNNGTTNTMKNAIIATLFDKKKHEQKETLTKSSRYAKTVVSSWSSTADICRNRVHQIQQHLSVECIVTEILLLFLNCTFKIHYCMIMNMQNNECANCSSKFMHIHLCCVLNQFVSYTSTLDFCFAAANLFIINIIHIAK